jgi:hypothetical protein
MNPKPKRYVLSALALSAAVTAFGCTGSTPPTHGVYMLLDTSGTYTEELGKANKIINYLLSELTAGDSMAVARIDSGSFSEKDILARVTFDNRPTTANEQKRGFMRQMDLVAKQVRPSRHTDITGGLIQAADWLRETGAGTKTVLIFSDLEEDLQKGDVRDFPLNVKGVHVIALNVTKLRSDNMDPREYQKRLDHWQARVEEGGGTWQVVNDLDRLTQALKI